MPHSIVLADLQKIANQSNSTWRVLDEGILKYCSGGCRIRSRTGNERMVTAVGYLLLCRANSYGVILNKFVDELSIANDSGDGVLKHPWELNAKPGTITWALIE